MPLPGWTGAPLHGLAGVAIVGAAASVGVPLLPLAALAVVVGVGGWAREKIQHPPFRSPLSAHQWREAAGWFVGAWLAWGVVAIVR